MDWQSEGQGPGWDGHDGRHAAAAAAACGAGHSHHSLPSQQGQSLQNSATCILLNKSIEHL